MLLWLDPSEQAQRLAQDMIDEMSHHEARDELGLGSVRDVIADMLAPGTSTLMTRARYYFYVAWMYRDIERKCFRDTERIVREVRSREMTLLRTLVARNRRNEAAGIIGRRSLLEHGGLPQRLPSEVYWSGLRTLGILLIPGGRQRYHRLLTAGTYEGGEDEGDHSTRSWDPHLPTPHMTTPGETGLVLAAEEAQYLRQRLATLQLLPGHQGSESLLYWLSDQQHPSETVTPSSAWRQAAKVHDRPFLVEAVERARWMSELMHGAQLVYNQLIERDLVQKHPLKAKDLDLDGTVFASELSAWSAGFDRRWFAGRDIAWFKAWQPFSRARIPATTLAFIDAWSQEVRRNPGKARTPSAQRQVQQREFTLKRGTSRLGGLDPQQLKNYRGAAGASALNFRWAVTLRFALDIRVGLAGR